MYLQVHKDHLGAEQLAHALEARELRLTRPRKARRRLRLPSDAPPDAPPKQVRLQRRHELLVEGR